MKYCIVTTCKESVDYAKLLATEILRFDIRAQLFANSGNSVIELGDELNFDSGYRRIKSSHFSIKTYDLFIVIGDRFDTKLLAKAKSAGIKTSYFQITFDHSSGHKNYTLALKKFDRVFIDLPIYSDHPKSETMGHYLNDLIRKYDFADHETDQLKVGFLIGNKSRIPHFIKLIKKLSPTVSGCEWLIGLDSSMDQIANTGIESISNARVVGQKFDVLKYANVVIVDSEKDAISASFLNCPQVFMANKKGLFSFSKSKRSLINCVLNKDLIKNFPSNQYDSIAAELNLVLNDHEYCASMMAGYQEFKEKVGTQPVARNAAQKIIDWLEEE